ncbi:magnesium transporter CorA family protein [Solimonas marina]|uniref:Magnesium transporter CorA family protein n=1 Tax=Solimonas marina TaxID=2714601 RepID=A0A969W7D8_9GAMM|nr:magnesium transporter CorA family protein [Solimonas marina]NKF21254.1 magnesium transporter CorA family protein [Solimonas marina]
MELYHFEDGKPPHRIDPNQPLPANGFFWADFFRDEAADWPCWAEPKVRAAIDPQHIEDSLNSRHPSFFDGTADYDMLIFQGLGPGEAPFPIEPRTTAMFIFKRVLVTICNHDSVSVQRVRARLFDTHVRPPGSPLLLAHLLLDTMVDRFLAIREPMAEQLTEMQDDLLDPNTTTTDWSALLDARKQVRRLEALTESQVEALDAWRRGTQFEWNKTLQVRVHDLVEHVNRVLNYASGQERDIEAAVQLYFAAVAHRTNKIMQVLTVLSAIFFPLTLIVGIYGMNFENMPELHWRYGYFYALGLLGTIAGSLYWYFKTRNFF